MKKIIYWLGGVLVLLGLVTGQVYASDEKKVVLQISPVKQDLELEAGKTYHGYFFVQNVGDLKFSYEASVTPYSVVNENYDPDYVRESSQTQITKWVTFEQTTGELLPGDMHKINYIINVPSNAPGGGQYAALMAETADSGQEGATLQTISRVGMLLYASVEGETIKEGEVMDLKIDKLLLNPPLAFSALVKNTGNVDFNTTMRMEVVNALTGEVVYDNWDNPEERIVLPETSRLSVLEWTEAPKLGVFKVRAEASALGDTQSLEQVILACPLWLILMGCFWIVLGVMLLVLRKRK